MKKPIRRWLTRELPVHYLDATKFPGGEIACGAMLPCLQSKWAKRSTKDKEMVSCQKCLRVIRREERDVERKGAK